jgi:RND superfamily putative drug exporter
MTRFFQGLGRFSVRYRFAIVAFWIVLVALLIHSLPSLSSVTKGTQSGFLPANTPSVQAQLLAAPFQNSNYASGTLVASRGNGPLTANRGR